MLTYCHNELQVKECYLESGRNKIGCEDAVCYDADAIVACHANEKE